MSPAPYGTVDHLIALLRELEEEKQIYRLAMATFNKGPFEMYLGEIDPREAARARVQQKQNEIDIIQTHLGIFGELTIEDIPRLRGGHGHTPHYSPPIMSHPQMGQPSHVAANAHWMEEISVQVAAEQDRLRAIRERKQIEEELAAAQAKIYPDLQALKPLIRKGQAPKAPRNEIIKQCLEELQFKEDQVFKFMLENHANLMTVGKKKKRHISEDSMWRAYRNWLKPEK
jgi:hypothetical protein